MCDPTTTQQLASNGVMAASTGASAVGSVMSGNAQQAAAYFQASQQEQQATAVQNQGYLTAQRIRTQGANTESAARAAFGASGVDVNTGSAAAVQKKIDENSDQDALQTIMSDDNQAESLRQQAVLTQQGGDNAARAGQIGALTSVLKGASMYGKTGWKSAANAGS